MHFMASKRLEGFLEDGSSIDMMKNLPFSQSSSSSSSRQKAFIPFTYNHNHHHKKQPWLYNNNNIQDQEEELVMMDSSSHPNGDENGNHIHQFIINPSPNTTKYVGGGECSETAAMAVVQKEHMFDKVVTPSDVGKLNRLVVPKQHAEKYFPLDSSINEKGLLLNFEDRVGKPWRFRYSYWNSSQSYVMTKGWSRFVKDKKLDAGDVVSFQRGVGEEGKHRFFIDWRRRPDAPPHPPFYRQDYYLQPPPVTPFSIFREQVAIAGPRYQTEHVEAAGPRYQREHQVHFHQSHHHAHNNNVYGRPSSFIYLKSTARNGGDGGEDDRQHWPTKVLDSVPVVQGKVAAKRLRLFGVNMDCPILETSTSNECEIIESKVIAQHQPFRPLISANETVNNKGKSSLALDLNIWQN